MHKHQNDALEGDLEELMRVSACSVDMFNMVVLGGEGDGLFVAELVEVRMVVEEITAVLIGLLGNLVRLCGI